MEYIDGQDLAELMRRGPLAPEFAVDVAIAVAATLEHAHHLELAIDGKDFHGIVHGDIKPKNIRIDARGDVRVLDFGIAKALSLSRQADAQRVRQRALLLAGAAGFGRGQRGFRPLVAGGDAVRDGDRAAALPRGNHRAAGAADSLAGSAAAASGALSGAAAADPEEGDGARSAGRATRRRASFADDLERFAARPIRGGRNRGPGRHPAHHADDEDGGETRRTATASSGERYRTDGGTSCRPPAGRPGRRRASGGRRTRLFRQTAGARWPFLHPALVCAGSPGRWSPAMCLYHDGQALERQIAIRTDHRSGPDLEQMDGTFEGPSSSLLLRGAAKGGEAEDGRGGGPRDRDLPQQRSQVYENSWKNARDLLAHALAVDPDDTHARQAAALRRSHRAHQRHHPQNPRGTEPGGGEVQRGAAPDAEVARSRTGAGAGLRVRLQGYR